MSKEQITTTIESLFSLFRGYYENRFGPMKLNTTGVADVAVLLNHYHETNYSDPASRDQHLNWVAEVAWRLSTVNIIECHNKGHQSQARKSFILTFVVRNSVLHDVKLKLGDFEFGKVLGNILEGWEKDAGRDAHSLRVQFDRLLKPQN